jgi:S1-C subfamily serine protease
VKSRSGTIHRADLTRVVDAGLGRFLQHVEVDASLEAGQFRGFRIVSLTPPEFWAGVDLRPGDVVMRINGMSIERPPQAYEAFTSLKTAPELVVSYIRQGQPRELVFPIQPAVLSPAASNRLLGLLHTDALPAG